VSIVSHPTNKNYRDNFDEVFAKKPAAVDQFLRRNRMDLWTMPERAIHEAHRKVEEMPADSRLTQAGILLQQAQDKVADFIDGIGRCARPNCTAQPEPRSSVCSDHRNG
jgi:hypothetical protein